MNNKRHQQHDSKFKSKLTTLVREYFCCYRTSASILIGQAIIHSYINLKNLPHVLIQVSPNTLDIYSNKFAPHTSILLKQYLYLAKFCCREMWLNKCKD